MEEHTYLDCLKHLDLSIKNEAEKVFWMKDRIWLCGESPFLRRIREVREKEPQREIVYTDETWLNGGHRVKKEWVDLKALENPCRSS